MSQAGPIDIIGTHPEIPTLFVCDVGSAVPIANTIETLGSVVAAGTHPFRSVGSGNTITYEVQISAAIAATDATAIGLCSFDSAHFSVDANGFVSLSGSGAIVTIDGDSGSITGNTVTVYANNASRNCGSSVKFVNSLSTSTLNVTDSNLNTFLGTNSGSLTTTGTQNTAFGAVSLSSVTSGNSNVALGVTSLQLLTEGLQNVAVGKESGKNLLTGSYNVLMGYGAGSAYTSSESNNILIGNTANGILGESNVLRIGNGTGTSQGNLSKAYISGINGVTVTTPALVSTDTSTDQLGVIPLPLSGALGGTGVANTGKTITIGGSVTFSGAYTFTGTLTGTTAVTFPTSGTLATTSGSLSTITGDSGTATVSSGNINVISNVAALNCGSSVTFTGSGATLTLNVTDASNNTFIGVGSGNSSLSGAAANCAFGRLALAAVSGASGANNNAFGQQTLKSCTSGGRNIGIGNSLISLVTGNRNIAVGVTAGNSYTGSESNNILIGDSVGGTLGESNVLRIGSGTGTGNGNLNKAFIAGINGVTSSSPKVVTINSSTDQMGVASTTSVGAFVLLSSQTASSSASIVFDNTMITDTYNNYLLIISNVTLGTASNSMIMSWSADNGSTFYSANFTSGSLENSWNSATIVNANSSSACVLHQTNLSPTYPSSWDINLFGLRTSGYPTFTARYMKTCNVNGQSYGSQIVGGATVNYIKFAMSAGNIATGTFRLYGIV